MGDRYNKGRPSWLGHTIKFCFTFQCPLPLLGEDMKEKRSLQNLEANHCQVSHAEGFKAVKFRAKIRIL
jgi:hypothetical protein